MIGLMEFKGRDTPGLPNTGSVPPVAGEVILMLKTDRMRELHQRLKAAALGEAEVSGGSPAMPTHRLAPFPHVGHAVLAKVE